MRFGEALELLRNGRLISREGWNGKGMFLYYVRAGIVRDLFAPSGIGCDIPHTVTREHIVMRTAQGDLVPWVASQTDLLACDWQEVELKASVEPVNHTYGAAALGGVQAQCGQTASAGYNKQLDR